MMKGLCICTQCGKSLASPQSLWNHKQRCNVKKRSRNADENLDDLSYSSTKFGDNSHPSKADPMVMQALLNEIINDRNIKPSLETLEKIPPLKKLRLSNFENDQVTEGSGIEKQSPPSVNNVIDPIDPPLSTPSESEKYCVDETGEDETDEDDSEQPSANKIFHSLIDSMPRTKLDLDF